MSGEILECDRIAAHLAGTTCGLDARILRLSGANVRKLIEFGELFLVISRDTRIFDLPNHDRILEPVHFGRVDPEFRGVLYNLRLHAGCRTEILTRELPSHNALIPDDGVAVFCHDWRTMNGATRESEARRFEFARHLDYALARTFPSLPVINAPLDRLRVASIALEAVKGVVRRYQVAGFDDTMPDPKATIPDR